MAVPIIPVPQRRYAGQIIPHGKDCGKRGHNVADTNVFFLLVDTKFVRDRETFLISLGNILCPQQMFPCLFAQATHNEQRYVFVYHALS